MNIIDVNAYLGEWPYWPLRDHRPADLLHAMDRLGIERAVISSLKAVFVDCPGGNAEVAGLCRTHSDRFVPAFTYHPYHEGRMRYREDLLEFPGTFLKLFPHAMQHTYNPAEEPFIHEMLDWCGEQRVPVLIPNRLLTSQRIQAIDMRGVVQLAVDHPGTRIVAAAINYAYELQSAMDGLRRAPNLMVDTSGMMAFRELEKLVVLHGPGRFVHGTAMPLQNPAIGPLRVNTAELEPDARWKILTDNARRLIDRKP